VSFIDRFRYLGQPMLFIQVKFLNNTITVGFTTCSDRWPLCLSHFAYSLSVVGSTVTKWREHKIGTVYRPKFTGWLWKGKRISSLFIYIT